MSRLGIIKEPLTGTLRAIINRADRHHLFLAYYKVAGTTKYKTETDAVEILTMYRERMLEDDRYEPTDLDLITEKLALEIIAPGACEKFLDGLDAN